MKQKMQGYPFSVFEVGLLTIAVLLMTESTAHAYIDPGTGSMVLQIVAGLFLAGLVTIKRWWRFVANLFKKKSDDSSEES